MPAIPPRERGEIRHSCDEDPYRRRRSVGDAFLRPKRWRGIAARHAEDTASLLVAVQIRRRALRANIS
jgi:hypothetical protein